MSAVHRHDDLPLQKRSMSETVDAAEGRGGHWVDSKYGRRG